jgi:hypothetical protein
LIDDLAPYDDEDAFPDERSEAQRNIDQQERRLRYECDRVHVLRTLAVGIFKELELLI